MIETSLYSIITTDERFVVLASDRLLPILLPDESPLPAATYQTITTTPLYTTDGRVNLTRYRVQFDTWATTYADAKALAQAITKILDSYSGPMADGSWIDSVQLASSSDLYESSARLYRVTADFFIQYSEPAL